MPQKHNISPVVEAFLIQWPNLSNSDLREGPLFLSTAISDSLNERGPTEPEELLWLMSHSQATNDGCLDAVCALQCSGRTGAHMLLLDSKSSVTTPLLHFWFEKDSAPPCMTDLQGSWQDLSVEISWMWNWWFMTYDHSIWCGLVSEMQYALNNQQKQNKYIYINK